MNCLPPSAYAVFSIRFTATHSRGWHYMPVDWGVIIPLFLLILLIGCFFVYLCYYKKAPSDPKEGFQVESTVNLNAIVLTNSTYQTIYGNIKAEEGSSVIWGPSLGSQSRAANRTSLIWPTTPLDKPYDEYWESEIVAIMNLIKTIPPILPPPANSNAGMSLADFDPLNPSIPWDQDNSEGNPDPSTCTWGKIHPEASKSIFLKNYIMNLIQQPSPPNCDPNSIPYCYASPMLGVQTTHSGWGWTLQVGVDGVASAVAQNMMMNQKLMESVGRGLYKAASITTYPVRYVAGKIGQNLASAFGEKVIQKTLSNSENRVAALLDDLIEAKVQMDRAKRPLYHMVMLPARLCIEAAAVANKLTAAIPIVNVVTAGTGFAICSALYVTSSLVLFTFNNLMIITLIAQTIVPILVSIAHKTGGVCPEGFQELHEYISPQVQAVLGIFVPGFAMLESVFQVYLCFKKDNWQMVLKHPPKTPTFMIDRTLSLTYHADWLTSHSSQSPEPSLYYTMVDPPPPCFTTFANSDLATSTNTSDIAQWASGTIPTGATSIPNNAGSGMARNPLNQLLYVQECPMGTTPSSDGKSCESTVYPITPIIPTLTECDPGQRDDGTNCITISGTSTDCTGGTITYVSSSIWDPVYGYNKKIQTEYKCKDSNGNYVVTPIPGKSYRQRITCPVGYEVLKNNITNEPIEDLCYPICREPPAKPLDTCNKTAFTFKRTGASCISTVETQARQIIFATARNIVQHQPYKPTMTLSEIKFPYCDFSSPIMLDRMAQFYYDNSFTHPTTSVDNSGNTTMSVQYITKFYSVIASSEMSCDVICEIIFVSFDLVTGGRYSSTRGCADSYSMDKTGWKGCPFCFRRFYFVHDPADPQGVFTVTACTMGDYTASSAMVKSTDFYINIPVGLSPLSRGNRDQLGKPSAKTWVENQREASIVDPAAFAKNSLQTTLQVTFGLGAFIGMMAGQAAVVSAAAQAGMGNAAQELAGVAFMVAYGVAQSYAEAALNKLQQYHIPPNQVNGQSGQFVLGQNNIYHVMSTNDWWTVDQGPIYELSQGYEPNIEWCRASYVPSEYCTYKYVLRDMVNYYHLVSPLKHIKQIMLIEPRGLKPDSQGCYYKWKEVDYDPVTNLESETLIDKEVIVPVTINDYSTCTYKMVKTGKNSFNTNVADPGFAVRSFIDPSSNTTIYPTRRLTYTSDLSVRFIRIRPSLLGGDGLLNITQIRVYDTSGNLVSFNKKVNATSTQTGALPAISVINGNIHLGNKLQQVWQSGNAVNSGSKLTGSGSTSKYQSNDSEYLEIDLEENVAISHVVYYGSSIPLLLIGNETWPTNARALVTAKNEAIEAANAAITASSAAVASANTAHPVTAWLDNLKESIVNPINDEVRNIRDGLALDSFSKMNYNSGAGGRNLPPPPSQLISTAVTATNAESTARDAAKTATAAATIYRNYGVRVQFLYNNTTDEVPIFEYVLPTDDPIQTVNVYSSATNVPMFPVSGPINIPRPISTAKYLGAPDCPYKCEDKPIIDSLVQQYNAQNSNSKILSVFNGTTASSGTADSAPSCEYHVELVDSDQSGGWKGSKGSQRTAQSISREYVTMTLQSNIVRPPTNVLGRFIVVTPSFTNGTVLEISKLLVYTYDRTACGSTCPAPMLNCSCISYRNNALRQTVSFFNGIISLAYNPIGAQAVVDGTQTPQAYINTNLAPPLFIAADNDPETFFQVDLGENMEIYQIIFVGRSDSDRTPGGIVGINLQIFENQPSNESNATDGTYPPVFSASLPTDACKQTINVVPIPQCSFTLMSSNKMVKPVYIQKDSPAFSAPDTSGGVFTFNSVIGSLKSVWNSILPTTATSPLVPATQSIIESGRLLGEIRDTISLSKTILETTNKCSDPAMLREMMTAYNILHSPSPTKQFSVQKKSIIQILKAGPSSPNSCDLLFEEKYDQYADYIIDATGNNTGTGINAARFVFTKTGGSGSGSATTISISPDSKQIYDISSNAIGIISDATILNPIFRGPAISVDCRDPTVVSAMLAAIKRADTKGSIYNTIAQTFQSSPLSCEYTIFKDALGETDVETFVRANFTLPKTLTSAVEYFPEDIIVTENPVTKAKSYFFEAAPNTRIFLPNLFSYDATRPSSRVNNNPIKI